MINKEKDKYELKRDNQRLASASRQLELRRLACIDDAKRIIPESRYLASRVLRDEFTFSKLILFVTDAAPEWSK